MNTVVTFGEVMTRFRVPGHKRLIQVLPAKMEVAFAGAEANVAASISLLGGTSRFVTSLPANTLGDACLAYLTGVGIDVTAVRRTDEGRMGSYYIEAGANQRASSVVYDRDYSSVSLAGPEAYDWEQIFSGAGWLHVSGITPALSQAAAEATIFAVREARKRGVTVSCDLNFRGKLWRWQKGTEPRELARETMRSIVEQTDLLIGNEGDADDVLGIRAGETEVHSGSLEVEHYPDVAKQIVTRFPNIKKVAITLRESISASHKRWGAMLYDAEDGSARFAPTSGGTYFPYEITHIVDRVGAGDSFAAGLIFALMDSDLKSDLDEVLSFAVAGSVLCHSIEGDFNFVSRAEVEALARGDASGRVRR